MNRNLPRHGIVVNTDVVGSSAGGHPRQADLADASESVLSDAIATAPVPDPWVRSPRGDGEVSIAPASVPAAWLLAGFLNTVYAGAVAYNRNKRHDDSGDDRLRLRLGIDCGDVLINSDGETRGGIPLVRAARLQNSPAAREATVAVPDAPLIAVISDELYQRVVPHRETGLRPEEFGAVTVEIDGVPVRAWLHLPHYPPPSVGAAPEKTPTPPPKSRPKAKSPAEPKSPSEDRAASKYDIKFKKAKNLTIGDNNEIHDFGGQP